MINYTGEMIDDLPFASYLAAEGFGSGDIRMFRESSPATVRWCRENRDAQGETQATAIGKAVHCRILTPDLFSQDFHCKGVNDAFRSKKDKAARDALLAAGKTILPFEDAETTRLAADGVLEVPEAKRALDNSIGREVSIFWTDKESGLLCKCRPDFWWAPDAEADVVDIKVTVDCGKPLDVILRNCFWNGWLNQLAHNREGLRAAGQPVQRGGLLLVPSSAPYASRVRLLRWSEESLDELEEMNRHTRKEIAACVEKGEWPVAAAAGWELQELPPNFNWQEAEITGGEDAGPVDINTAPF